MVRISCLSHVPLHEGDLISVFQLRMRSIRSSPSREDCWILVDQNKSPQQKSRKRCSSSTIPSSRTTLVAFSRINTRSVTPLPIHYAFAFAHPRYDRLQTSAKFSPPPLSSNPPPSSSHTALISSSHVSPPRVHSIS